MADTPHPGPQKGVTAYLTVTDAKAAIAFYEKAFGAREIFRHDADDGKRLLHAALEINGGALFLSDDFPEMASGKSRTPGGFGGTPVTLHMDVANVDEVFDRAIKAGADVIFPVADMFWGDRFGKLRDPFGHEWSIATPAK